jgi:hypothetical protein
MGVDENDLSAVERQLAEEISRLAVDPTPERRAAILRAVRVSQASQPSQLGSRRWALAAVGAIALLLVGTVGAAAASTDALPSSPTYPVRGVVEQSRIWLAGPAAKEQLRIEFAKSRFAQALSALTHGDRSDADVLVRDGSQYLDDARNDIGTVPAGEQGSVQNQLNQAQNDEQQAEDQLNQQGKQH